MHVFPQELIRLARQRALCASAATPAGSPLRASPQAVADSALLIVRRRPLATPGLLDVAPTLGEPVRCREFMDRFAAPGGTGNARLAHA